MADIVFSQVAPIPMVKLPSIEELDKRFLTRPENLKVDRLNFEKLGLPDLKDFIALVIDNVLQPSECRLLAQAAEAHFEKVGWEHLHNSQTKEWLDGHEISRVCCRGMASVPKLWENIWNRVRGIIPEVEELTDPLVTGMTPIGGPITWRYTRLNERARFLKYGPGEFMKPHFDEFFERPDKKERSFFTVQVFLVDSEHPFSEKEGEPSLQGGGIRFHSDSNPDHYFEIEPKIGRLILFQQSGMLHSGAGVTQGTKMVIKTDLLYSMAGK